MRRAVLISVFVDCKGQSLRVVCWCVCVTDKVFEGRNEARLLQKFMQ